MCCSPWGRKESDTTEQLKNNNNSRSLGTQLFPQQDVINGSSPC